MACRTSSCLGRWPLSKCGAPVLRWLELKRGCPVRSCQNSLPTRLSFSFSLSIFVVLAALISSLACDAKPAPRDATIEEKQAISSIVDQANLLKQIAMNPGSGSDVITAMDFGAYKCLISPTARDCGTRSSLRTGAFPDCAKTTVDMTSQNYSAEFTMCEVMGHTIDGTVAVTNGNTVTADVTDTFNATEQGSGMAKVDADITITETSVNGHITVDASAQGAGMSANVNATVDFDNVIVDSMFCPTSGTLSLTGTAKLGDQSLSAEVTVTFGPSCGDVQKS